MKRIALYLILVYVLTSCKPKPVQQLPIDNWYKHLIIYNLDVKTFQDSNGNGEGDFTGLVSRLYYLQRLGINTIWLAPFQPSPLDDDGYDITNYTAIDPKLGTKADFNNFMIQAKSRHLRVIMDVVLNHTSIRHAWFRQRPN